MIVFTLYLNISCYILLRHITFKKVTKKEKTLLPFWGKEEFNNLLLIIQKNDVT